MAIDPTTMTSFQHIGKFEYDEGITDINAPDEFPNPRQLKQMGIVYFPSDSSTASNPSQISSRYSKYPLVVIAHGNSNRLDSYKGYNYLLEHLAHNGFIAASIHMYPNAEGVSRARAIFKHLEIMKSKFENRIDLSRIGLMGHSRGGEAVVISSILNKQENLGYNFKAIISLAPTDQYGPYSLKSDSSVPYLVIYGSLDGDVNNYRPKVTGFSLYDRADPLKSFLFVERASHGRFNTVWGDVDLSSGVLTDEEIDTVISIDAHEKIIKGYVNAFLSWHLYDKDEMHIFFSKEELPLTIAQADGGSIKIRRQFQNRLGLFIDKFDNNNSKKNSLNDNVTISNNLMDPLESDLVNLDRFSPHDANGMLIQWNSNNGKYSSEIPLQNKDLSQFRYLSFRVCQKHRSNLNPVGSEKDFLISLIDHNNNIKSLKLSDYSNIPYPFIRKIDEEILGLNLTMSALKTIRISLNEFVVGNHIDLTNIKQIVFEFHTSNGELEITDLEVTN